MFKKIVFVATFSLIFALGNVSASMSTAGQNVYDAQDNLLPIQDPAMDTSYPVSVPEDIAKLPKRIEVDLSTQTLSYYYGDTYKVGEIKISSGLPRTPTPVGTFTILAKIPVKEYIGRNFDGTWYDLKNTQWNLRISNLGYYIHGAYWHNNFGHPMSHGCINVSYTDMPALYAFADVGTTVTIHK